jgi:DNA-binding response OmpR family regulator
VAQELRRRPGTRGVPIIALTAHATASDRESALEAGCDDFEVKPVALARLLPRIEALLARGDRP